MKTTSKMKMTLKNGDDIKNEDDLRNLGILKSEDKTTLPGKIGDDSSAWQNKTEQNSVTDPKLEMLADA